MPEDIRQVPAEQDWSRFETTWTSLLTYRYLGRRSTAPDMEAGETDTIVLRSDMSTPPGPTPCRWRTGP